MKYETLKIEEFPPKQKLRMLQNAVGDVTKISYVKPISDQNVARGNLLLACGGYMELLLLACSTYVKKFHFQGKQKRAVYTTTTSDNGKHIPSNKTLDGEYEVFTVDTDVSVIMVNSANMNCFGNRKTSGIGKLNSNFLPCDERNKITITQEQKDQFIAK
jgi:hypothetical protein